jgi:glyoxylase-like metal-dependent hydrolase (beta-lactamase superfamily II)
MVFSDEARVIGTAGILRRFPDATEDEYRRAFVDIGRSLDEADDNFNILLAQIGAEVVLVDAGQGGRSHGGHLPASMAQAGIAPEAITLVMITHVHGDHVQGLLTDTGEPAFPHATYVISRAELAFWEDRNETGIVDHRAIVDMVKARGLRVIDPDEAIMPGLTAVPLPGHTPGHTGLLLESDGERLLHVVDLLHSPMQFAYPEWSAVFDDDTAVSVPMRKATLKRAANEDILMLFYHLTFPGLGRVRQADGVFSWESLETGA